MQHFDLVLTFALTRLCRSDPDLKRISGPALNIVVASAVSFTATLAFFFVIQTSCLSNSHLSLNQQEHFIRLLTKKSREVAISSGRKTIKYDDVEQCGKEGGWRLSFMLGKTTTS